MIKKQRNSSVELLRILSMLLIVLYHFNARQHDLYVVTEFRPEEPNFIFELLTHSLGKIGVPVFVFISGWYGIRFKKDRFIDIGLQCLFYASISFIGMNLIGGHIALKNVIFFLNNWWFAASYLCLYVLAPCIEKMFSSYGKKHMLFIVALFYFLSYGDIVVQSAKIGGLYLMFAMYLSARWIRMYASDILAKYSMPILCICLIFRVIVVLMAYKTNHLNLLGYINSYVCPITTLLAASLFIVGIKYTFSSDIVNKLASSCFAVYLLSESGFGQVFFKPLFPEEFSFWRLCLGAVAVYLLAICVDVIRKIITNLIFSCLKNKK